MASGDPGTPSNLDDFLVAMSSDMRNIIYAWCLDQEFRSVEDITSNLISLVPGLRARTPKRTVQESLEVFMERGVVQGRTLQGLHSESMRSYALTDMGALAHAAPAYAIKFAVDNELPMVALLGIARDARHMTAPTRYDILTNLTNAPKSSAWLAEKTGIPKSFLPDHLRKLSTLGLITYTTFQAGELPETRAWLKPGLLPSAIPAFPRRSFTSAAVVELLNREGRLTYSEIAEKTGYAEGSVKNVVSYLASRKYIVLDYDPENRSKITLTSKGHRAAEGLRKLVQAASGERMAHELAPLDIRAVRAAYASAAFRLYAQHRGLAK